MDDFLPYDHKVLRDTALVDPAEIIVSPEETRILRDLASEYAEYAFHPRESGKRQLQRSKNNLEWVKPLVICFPETSWREILPTEALVCSSKTARGFENALRQNLFIARMDSDQCLEQTFNIGFFHQELNWGARQVQIGDLEHGSYKWDAPINREEDLSLMCAPTMKVDFHASELLLELADDVLGDILPVQRKESWFWTNGLTQTLIYLRGLEEMMFDMIDRPAFLQAMMQRLSEGTLYFLDELERENLLFPNWDIAYCGSGGLGLTDHLPQSDFDGRVRLSDLWGFSESQETVGVSPRMFAKFILPYQRPLIDRFGLSYYGCCEPVDKRWDYLREIPNLRRLSVSPWSDREAMAHYLGRDYVYCLKPNPAVMAREVLPEDEIRAYTRETLDIAGECHLEFILKDVTTVNHQQDRVNRWVAIVKEEIDRRYR
ncbi:MAG: hypothetical protein HPY85_14030 [Anaerolineae bacterium]|nr:hypothetical protein [Anaerolineae bacterium]